MSRRKKDPLRSLTEKELLTVQHISRSHTAPAVAVVRAKLLLLVAQDSDYQNAVRAVGRRNREAASLLVARFNAEGAAALTPRQGGGQKPRYGEKERPRILTQLARPCEPLPMDCQAFALCSLAGHQGRRATPQQNPTGWQRGTLQRKRKDGTVSVTDPDIEATKSCNYSAIVLGCNSFCL